MSLRSCAAAWAEAAKKKFPELKVYQDWREMLDKEHKNLDCVNVSTPEDASSSRYGQSLYAFLPHAWKHNFLNAWVLEAKELKRRGIAVLLVEQKLTIALEVSERCLVMGHGRIVFEGTPAGLKADSYVRKEWLEV